MSSTIAKEWAAIDGEEVVAKAPTKAELRGEIDTTAYEVVALPKPYRSVFV